MAHVHNTRPRSDDKQDFVLLGHDTNAAFHTHTNFHAGHLACKATRATHDRVPPYPLTATQGACPARVTGPEAWHRKRVKITLAGQSTNFRANFWTLMKNE